MLVRALSWLVAACALFALAGCAPEKVVELRQWTLTTASRPDAVITLPTHLDAELGEGRAAYALRARVRLPQEWRGRDLTLAIPFLQAPVTLTVDGAEATPLEWSLFPDAPSLGPHAFRIESRGEELALRLDVDCRSMHGAWLDTVPRLSATPRGDRSYLATRVIDRDVAVAAFATLSMIGFLYFVLYFFDRRRHVHVWFAFQAVGAAYFILEQLGIPQTFGGPAYLSSYTVALSAVAAVRFTHLYFRLGAPHRFFDVLAAVAVVSAMFGSGAFASRGWQALGSAVGLITVPYQMGILARLWKRGPDRFSAGVLFAAWGVLALMAPVDATWTCGFGELAGGAHTLALGFGVYSVVQAVVLGRDHIRSLREADALNVELSARVALLEKRDRENERLQVELRGQIADKSQRLADALARIGAVPERVVALAPGDEVHGRYRVLRALGAGGMGAVHEVERIADGVRFALKVLTSASTGVALARLAREAQIAAQVSHENLVAIADVDVSDTGALYLVMELVEGAPLQELSARFGDVAWARGVLRQIARGLAAIHERGIVHRDLKPGNVLVTKDDAAKIADFGIARLDADTADPLAATVATDRGLDPTLEASDVALTATGALMGTPLYMAPELARGAERASASSDIWSLGVIAFEILDGRFPFAVAPVLDALAGRAIDVPSMRAELSDEERAIVARCLSLDPAARPSADRVARAFG
jgi:serine/threonine-protein kinase